MAKSVEPRLEKAGFLKDCWSLWAPKGYKFKLWSYGQYGLHVILVKIEEHPR